MGKRCQRRNTQNPFKFRTFLVVSTIKRHRTERKLKRVGLKFSHPNQKELHYNPKQNPGATTSNKSLKQNPDFCKAWVCGIIFYFRPIYFRGNISIRRRPAKTGHDTKTPKPDKHIKQKNTKIKLGKWDTVKLWDPLNCSSKPKQIAVHSWCARGCFVFSSAVFYWG